MDDIDHAIIDELKADARVSNVALADRVGLTPGPCLRRVQRLEADGVIVGYRAEIDPHALGQGFEVILDIELADFHRAAVDHFEATMVGYDEVLELYRLFGSPDYFARIAVSDVAAYEAFLTDRVMTIPRIQKVFSRFPMKTLKSLRSTEGGPR
ncbi:Lrp/AsnC family transcriptional regulator [Nocardiopsis sp. MG754419]|uniref:Lrp/AsnC family transcriptional regulator n=1 Tax=Nocardiopsis sp. MG754419 TaxID=2259865 RepID=UPI001BA46974|nr:Lrp/AsnC family transcriptional regulator [Nocardiopsis sp. MG754419]MBR8743227.1 Lrp/AsnC family transcriptional regulator [Nocardiopsis sp. MG754419]